MTDKKRKHKTILSNINRITLHYLNLLIFLFHAPSMEIGSRKKYTYVCIK